MMIASLLPDLASVADLGYFTLFLWVFLEQAGLPIPAIPVLVAAGALISAGHLDFSLCFSLAVAASMGADLIWYYLGRVRGSRVLNLICRISWKPDQCITTTTGLFTRFGDKTLLFAKFVPGLSTLAPPMAGMAGLSPVRFFWYDLAGCAVWAALPLAGGMFLHRLPTPQAVLEEARAHFLLVGGAILLGFLVWRLLWRLFYRLNLHKELRGGLPVEELKRMLDAGREVAVVDVRHPLSIRKKPVIVPTARLIGYKELLTRHGELPAGHPVVVYCDCPTDEGAVAAVWRLRKLGVPSARPLLGGLDAWIDRGFETAESTASGLA